MKNCVLMLILNLLIGFESQACEMRIKCSDGGTERCSDDGDPASCGSDIENKFSYCTNSDNAIYICCLDSGATYRTSSRDSALANCDTPGDPITEMQSNTEGVDLGGIWIDEHEAGYGILR